MPHVFAHEFVEALKSHPDVDELLRIVVVTLPERYGAGSAALARVRADGELEIVSTFGSSCAMTPVGTRYDMWDDLPITRAFRSSVPLVLTTGSAVLDAFPVLRSEAWHLGPIAATSLDSSGAPIGALLLNLRADVPSPADVVPLETAMTVLGSLVGLYLGLYWRFVDEADSGAAENPHRIGVPVASGTQAGRSGDPAALTPRQHVVLRLLGDELTNAEIAFHIGYSESTVRQETVALYRLLGVSDRHQAVRAARGLGILAAS